MKVLKIGAVWCSGCLVMRPRWQEVQEENPWLATEYIDYDSDKDKIESLDIQGGKLPTFIFLDQKGHEIRRLSGEISKDELTRLINENKDK